MEQKKEETKQSKSYEEIDGNRKTAKDERILHTDRYSKGMSTSAGFSPQFWVFFGLSLFFGGGHADTHKIF
jgi:hypothetical protein